MALVGIALDLALDCKIITCWRATTRRNLCDYTFQYAKLPAKRLRHDRRWKSDPIRELLLISGGLSTSSIWDPMMSTCCSFPLPYRPWGRPSRPYPRFFLLFSPQVFMKRRALLTLVWGLVSTQCALAQTGNAAFMWGWKSVRFCSLGPHTI